MPIFFPLGHEHIRKRFPRITIGLIVINTVLYFLTFSFRLFEGPGMFLAQTQLEEYEKDLVRRYLTEQKGAEDPDDMLYSMSFRGRRNLIREFREDMEAGGVVDPESGEYLEWKMLYEDFRSQERGMLDMRYGLRPLSFKLYSLVTHQFLHGDFWHLLWNMYFLWLVGCNLEDAWGRKFFLGLYLIGGVFAGLAHSALYFNSYQGQQPLIGASGAVSAVMGAFLIKYWDTKIRFAFFWKIVWVPAWIALLAWFGQQLYYGIKYMYEDVPVAFWAHIGGFAFGVVVAYAFQRLELEEKVIARELEKQDERDRHRIEARQQPEKLLKMQRPDELVMGIEARKIGRYEEAREHLEKALELYPRNFDVHFELQQLYQRMGLIKEANRHQGLLIGVMLDMDMTDAALERYELLERADPEAGVPGQGMYRMARVLEERKKFESAASGYRKFAAANPGDRLAPKALFQCGNILLEKLKKPKSAAQMFEYVLDKYPEAPGKDIVEEALKSARKKAIH